MTKDSVKLNASLSTLVDAKKHVDKWPSTADNSGEPLRNAMHFLQRSHNTVMSEVHDTQAASLLLNYPASMHTERFAYLASWDYVREACNIFGIQPNNELKADAPLDVEGEEDEEDNETVEIGKDTAWMRDQKQEQYDGMGGEGKSITYRGLDDEPIAVSAVTHYRLRGEALLRFSPKEYAACISVVRMSAEEIAAAMEEEDMVGDGMEEVELAPLEAEPQTEVQRPRARRGRRANGRVRARPTPSCP